MTLQVDAARGDPRDVEQVVDHPHHVLDLPLHHAVDAVKRRPGIPGQPHQLEAGAQRRERVAQLVRERGEEFVLTPVGVAQAFARLHLFGDVGEQDRDAALLGCPDPKREHIEDVRVVLGHGRTLEALRIS